MFGRRGDATRRPHARLPPTGALLAGLHGLDTRVFELAAGTLSLWYMIALIGPGQHNGPVPGPLWAVVALVGGTCKVLGVLTSLAPEPPPWSGPLRVWGAAIGVVFWTVLATVLAMTVRGGITWGGFALLAGWQAWCLLRHWRGGR